MLDLTQLLFPHWLSGTDSVCQVRPNYFFFGLLFFLRVLQVVQLLPNLLPLELAATVRSQGSIWFFYLTLVLQIRVLETFAITRIIGHHGKFKILRIKSCEPPLEELLRIDVFHFRLVVRCGQWIGLLLIFLFFPDLKMLAYALWLSLSNLSQNCSMEFQRLQFKVFWRTFRQSIFYHVNFLSWANPLTDGLWAR